MAVRTAFTQDKDVNCVQRSLGEALELFLL